MNSAGWRAGRGILSAALAVASARAAAAAEQIAPETVQPADSPPAKAGRSPHTKTLGGRQFWADVEYFHRWSVQKNVITGHFRLLDGDNYRHASGTRDQCRQRLDEIRAAQRLPPMSGEAVILIHGLGRSAKSMETLGRGLERDEHGFCTIGFCYPSMQVDLEQAAEFLRSVIESLEGIERIHFVTHSLGGLVARTYLSEDSDPRIGRLVMIATPNLGAELADRFHRHALYRAVFGPVGQQLTGDPQGFIANLPVPALEFGVIAGGRGNEAGYNPLVPGDDDGTVSVECTRLPGAADFVRVDRLHTFLISAPEACEMTARFLKSGAFREHEPRQPIPRITTREAAQQARQP